MSRELHHHIFDLGVSLNRVRAQELAQADAERRRAVDIAIKRESAIQRTVESLQYLLALHGTRPELAHDSLWERAADLVDANEAIRHPKE